MAAPNRRRPAAARRAAAARSTPPVLGVWRSLRLRPRLLVALALGVAMFVLSPVPADRSTRLLLAWNGAVALYLALIIRMMVRADAGHLKRRAEAEDEGRSAILALTLLAAAVSLVSIGVELHAMGGDGRAASPSPWRMALVASTIVLSWAFTQMIFSEHYARLYYEANGGLEFPGPAREPDYWDFVYFSFTIGAAVQTSDVAISAPAMRHLVTLHTIIAFLFNTAVLALAINVGASLI